MLIIAIEKWGFKMNNAEHNPKLAGSPSPTDRIRFSEDQKEESDLCGQTYFPSW
jgi:hypothetical protein